jgi:hypothetical protein
MRKLVMIITMLAATAGIALVAVPAASAGTYRGPLPCSPRSIDEATYRGGFVDDLPQVNLIFWGSWWVTNVDTAPKVISELQNEFKGLTGSSWAQTVTQYCGLDIGSDQPQIANFSCGSSCSSTLLSGSVFDPYDPPPAPTGQDLADETERGIELSISERGAGSVGDVNMIITPPGVVPQSDTANNDCGSHGAGYANYNGFQGLLVNWANVPYGRIVSDPSRCQPHGNPADGLSLVAGHEWAENVTDPYPDMGSILPGWAGVVSATSSSEIGDLCEPDQTNLSGKTVDASWVPLSTGKFWMQQLWSNEAGPSSLQGKCVKGS